MTIEYEITPEEYAKFSAHTALKWDSARKNNKKIRFVFGPLLMGIGIGLMLSVDESWFTLFVGSIAILIGVCFLSFSQRSNYKQLVRSGVKFMEKEENRAFIIFRRTVLDDYGINVETEYEKSDMAWKGFLNADETPDLFLIYNTEMSAIIVPKRIFENDDEERFRRILEDRQLKITYFQQ